jgi:hypothetical protein
MRGRIDPPQLSETPQYPVGAAAGCDLLILILKKQDQKIAACGSSYAKHLP